MADNKKLTTEEPQAGQSESADVTAVANEMFQVGDSGNRPSDPLVNTIYYSINTGTRERYNGGGNWELIDNLHN